MHTQTEEQLEEEGESFPRAGTAKSATIEATATTKEVMTTTAEPTSTAAATTTAAPLVDRVEASPAPWSAPAAPNLIASSELGAPPELRSRAEDMAKDRLRDKHRTQYKYWTTFMDDRLAIKLLSTAYPEELSGLVDASLTELQASGSGMPSSPPRQRMRRNDPTATSIRSNH
jgi:hypothetical protein